MVLSQSQDGLPIFGYFANKANLIETWDSFRPETLNEFAKYISSEITSLYIS
jgi:hypothetical protein